MQFMPTTSKVATLLAGLVFLATAQAGVTLNTTRVVFEGKHKEANLEAQNRGPQEILLQSWLDNGRGTENSDTALPFAVTPPLAKVGANGRQTLRILYQGQGMPADRESVLWLNVQEIPKATEQENVLQLAVRQRIKVFYRPVGLPGSAEKAPELIKWQLAGNAQNPVLRGENASVYHVSMASLGLKGGSYDYSMDGTTMLLPGETREWPLTAGARPQTLQLRFESINDYGGQAAYTSAVSSATASTAAAEVTP